MTQAGPRHQSLVGVVSLQDRLSLFYRLFLSKELLQDVHSSLEIKKTISLSSFGLADFLSYRPNKLSLPN
jgi:hypothetical protein